MSELAHKGTESLFRSEQFQVFCMSFIRSHLPEGEKSPNRIASVNQAIERLRYPGFGVRVRVVSSCFTDVCNGPFPN